MLSAVARGEDKIESLTGKIVEGPKKLLSPLEFDQIRYKGGDGDVYRIYIRKSTDRGPDIRLIRGRLAPRSPTVCT